MTLGEVRLRLAARALPLDTAVVTWRETDCGVYATIFYQDVDCRYICEQNILFEYMLQLQYVSDYLAEYVYTQQM